MPLVVITGLPCSGKSTAAGKLASWLEEELGKKVELVSEEQMLADLTKNQVFSDSKHEKAVRGRLKSEVMEIIGFHLVSCHDMSGDQTLE